MRFKSDEQRKAAFANMFGGNSSRKFKVNSGNVQNFEVSMSKSTKLPKVKSIRFGYNRVRMRDVKTKAESESCKLCKRKGQELESQTCKDCTGEMKVVEEEREKIRIEAQKKIKNAKTLEQLKVIKKDLITDDLFTVEIKKMIDEKEASIKVRVREKLERSIGGMTTLNQLEEVEIALRRENMFSSRANKMINERGTEILQDKIESFTPSGRKREWPRFIEDDDQVFVLDSATSDIKVAKYLETERYRILRSQNELRGTMNYVKANTYRRGKGKYGIYRRVGKKRTSAQEEAIRGQKEEIERLKPFATWSGFTDKVHTDDLVKGGWRNHINWKGKHWTFVGTYGTESRLRKATQRAREKFPGHTLKQIKTRHLYKSPFSGNYPKSWMGFTSSIVGNYALYREEKRPDFLRRYHRVRS